MLLAEVSIDSDPEKCLFPEGSRCQYSLVKRVGRQILVNSPTVMDTPLGSIESFIKFGRAEKNEY